MAGGGGEAQKFYFFPKTKFIFFNILNKKESWKPKQF